MFFIIKFVRRDKSLVYIGPYALDCFFIIDNFCVIYVFFLFTSGHILKFFYNSLAEMAHLMVRAFLFYKIINVKLIFQR